MNQTAPHGYLSLEEGGGGSGIQFDVEPQSGTWLEIETTGVDSLWGYGISLIPSDGLYINTGTTGGGMQIEGSGANVQLLQVFPDSSSNATGINVALNGTSVQQAIQAQAITSDGTDATGIFAVGETNAHSGTGTLIGVHASGQSVSSGQNGDAIGVLAEASVAGTGHAYAIKVTSGLVALNLPTSPGLTGTLYSTLGIVTVSP